VRYALLSAAASFIVASAATAQTSKGLEGCWSLRSLVVEKAGEKTEPYGAKPIGQLILTPDGHFSNIQMRPDLAADASTQPKGGVVSGTLSYFGTYQVMGSDFTVKIEGSTRADWKNQTSTRVIQSSSPDLIFIDKPMPDLTVRSVWGRCSA
jgi:hypothetical protein